MITMNAPSTPRRYSDEQKAQVVQKVRSVFVKNRNLGEDLDSVNIEQSEACFLKGVIETTGKRNPAAIYADVFSILGWVGVGCAIFMFALTPLLNKQIRQAQND